MPLSYPIPPMTSSSTLKTLTHPDVAVHAEAAPTGGDDDTPPHPEDTDSAFVSP
jgi:hypothetical protein